MKSWLRRFFGRIGVRLLVANLFVVLVPVAGLEFAETHESQLLLSLERDMRNQSALVKAELENDLSRDPEASFFDRAANDEPALERAARSTRTRVRLLDFDGAVVADSHASGPPEGVEAPAPRVLPEIDLSLASGSAEAWPIVSARQEVVLALHGQFATRTRVREREPMVMLFIAEPVIVAGEVRGVVYVTRSTQPVLFELYRVREQLILFLALAMLFGTIVTFLLALDLSRPLSQLVRAAREITAGNLRAPVLVRGRGEVRELCEAFVHMRDRLVGRLLFAREFAADVAHEFRSPLTSMRGASELLLDGADEDPVARRRFLENIREDTERLTALTDRLLLLGRIEGRESAMTEVDVVEVCRAALARRSEASLSVPPDGAARALVRGRAEDLRAALDNLLDNAEHHRETDDVVVRVDVRGGAVRIAVTNDGPGIESSAEGRVFDRFFTTRRERGGTGLGLAIVRAVAEAHGGRVELESKPGRTVFTLVMPVAK